MKDSFGSIHLDGGVWHINCEAHVRNKIKRFFPECDQRGGEVIRLSDNPEHCRDLLWFLERYPMEVPNRRHLKQQAQQHVDQEDKVLALLRGHRPPEPFELASPPRDYQAVAASLCQLQGGLLVADAVGLGKSMTSICNMPNPQYLPALVVTLTHLPEQWAAEIQKFAPQLKVHILKSGKPYELVKKKKKKRKAQAALFEEPEDEERLPDVIISNYHKIHGWVDVLTGFIKYIVLDECQEIRHEDSLKSVAAAMIAGRAKLRMGLSATPIHNYGIEFFNVLSVLHPGALGTREEFMREWCTTDHRIADPKRFGEYLRREGLMIGRTRKDVGRELPPMSRVIQTIPSDPSVLDRIEGSAVSLARTILAANESFRGQKFEAAREFDILMRQATGIAKAPYVADFVRMLLDREEKVVVFAWHREVINILSERLKDFNPRLYTGTESPNQKNASRDAFVTGDCRVLIISLRAGTGLDGLQDVCTTGVAAELDWSPAVLKQNEGRIDRERTNGIQEQCMMFYLLADEGSDPVIADILGIKRGQLEGVMNPDANLVEQLDQGGAHTKALAQRYLQRRGAPEESAEILEAA